MKRRVFVDGQPGKEYESRALVAGPIRFNSGELHVAYEVHGDKEKNDKSFVVLNGEEGTPFERILQGTAHFSGQATVTYLARNGRTFFRVTQSLQEPQGQR